MPCDYSKYPKNWKSEIRPRILDRANHSCEKCKVPNYTLIIRGMKGENEVYQNMDGIIYNCTNGERMGEDYLGNLKKAREVKVVLTIAHLDHNTTNNDDANLRAYCQKCHINHDKDFHLKNRARTNEIRKGMQSLFE
ncbi:hypothetical protein [Chryseobacterium sp. 18068]|uniref:hypothetical protein n=1 Tax=Chryseobacterium sp. 18068 TaxID=2681414 RepID=UPI00135CAD68|nr:hypothetical protein [Chryseobacterium sp. 18068]